MSYREKGNSWGNGLTRGSGPTKRVSRSTGMFSLWKWSTDRRVGPTVFYWKKDNPGRNGPWVAWRFRGTGRRGRRPLQGILPIEGQFRKKADIHPLPPGERQRKEKLVHSSRDKPPLNPITRGKSFRLRRSFSRAPVASPVTSFSLLDRARPVFSFSSGRKRENGGCNEPAIAGCHSPRPQGRVKAPPLAKAKIYDIIYHPYEITEIR